MQMSYKTVSLLRVKKLNKLFLTILLELISNVMKTIFCTKQINLTLWDSFLRKSKLNYSLFFMARCYIVSVFKLYFVKFFYTPLNTPHNTYSDTLTN